MSGPTETTRQGRRSWNDRWLLEAFQRLGHPAIHKLAGTTAESAWEALERAGVTADELLETTCAMASLPAADLSQPDAKLAPLLDGVIALRYGVIPVRAEPGLLEVATANPLQPHLDRDLEFATGRRVRLSVATPAAIRRASEVIYATARADPGAARFSWVLPDRQSQPLVAPLHGAAVEALDEFVPAAIEQRASDIHFEPLGHGLVVRVRVDGVLRDVGHVPEAQANQVISRIKVMGGLDIADRKRPQDGRASVLFEGRSIDLRISTLPLSAGVEKAVLRILDPRVSVVDLDHLGFIPGEKHRFEKLLDLSQGLVLVTGPTGSGKTTTLYSALRRVQSRETNIVTVEDPIEYRLEGINQVQVHERSGLTFAAALRSILRQDPDVVLVGEIRDRETAEIAIKAGMTGHLVLATLHTNDAVAAVPRLADIGVELGALSGALKGVVAQRLVRRLCRQCSQPQPLSDLPVDHQMFLTGKAAQGLRRAVGCAECSGTGYRGRVVVAEILTLTPELQRAIARRAEVEELERLAHAAGKATLWEAGIERVLNGVTSMHELLDNVSPPITGGGQSQAEIDALLLELMPARPATAAGAPSARSGAVAVSQVAPTFRVLLVDEGREDRAALRRALEAAGFGTIEAADGEAAVAYARKLKPDVVITEITLPKLDGAELLAALRELRLPVVVCTGQRDEALHGWMRELGALDVFSKPVDAEAVVDRLRRLTAGKA
jgi:type II secretory ATPase GspE/PulE/Tfp pilus assembly ATPase PilB-like protein/CheY-like chemotaxis protein